MGERGEAVNGPGQRCCKCTDGTSIAGARLWDLSTRVWGWCIGDAQESLGNGESTLQRQSP